MDEPIVLPAPCLVVLVGPSGAGKTTWAHRHVGVSCTVSSDALRALVGEGEDDLAATTDAFDLLEIAVERRVKRHLTTVVDTLGMDAERRARWRELGRRHALPVVCVAFDVPTEVCRARNRDRDKRVPTQVLTDQAKRYRALRAGLDLEGFDLVVTATAARLAPAAMAATAALATEQEARPIGLGFGLQLPVFTWPGGPVEIGQRVRAIGRAAEEAGFESLWVMDHLRQIPMFGPAWHDMLESWTTLAHLAAVTDRIRLGTLVSGITYRNVAQLGKIVATLDVLSGGRAECGLGAAWFKAEHDAFGLPFPSVAERYALLEDALRFLPVLWGPGSPAFAGRALRVPEAMCYPRPLQPHLPITVGGNGERHTLRLAATLADACNIIGDVGVVTRKVAVVHAHADAIGRDRAAVRITQLSTTLVGRDADEVQRLVAAQRPARVSAAAWAARVNAGTVADQVGRFRALADAGVQSAIVSLPDLAGVEPIERFREVIDAFRV
jgi:F420-dependent oxidoreductase-like protein